MFKTHFLEAHQELTNTGEFTLKQSGYGQANLAVDIVNRLSTEFQHQENMVNSAPLKDPAPTTETGTAEIMQQVLAQNLELMQLLSDNNRKSGWNNTNIPPNPSTGPCQGQHCHPMTAYFDKYF